MIEGRSPECAFWNLCLWNPFLHTYDYAYDRVTINGDQVAYEHDGSWRVVVAPTRPGPPQLGPHGRPPAGTDLVPLVPPREHAGPAHHQGGPHRCELRRGRRVPTGPGSRGQRIVTGRPGPVVLEDLAHPRFSPEIEQLRESLSEVASGCPLESDALCRAAVDQTGSDDFGDDRFRHRLDVLCCALVEEGDLSASGVVSWYSQLLQFLKNRLLIQDLLTRHPEIHEITIERPIIICGLPRTGTTHLHNLMARRPRLAVPALLGEPRAGAGRT